MSGGQEGGDGGGRAKKINSVQRCGRRTASAPSGRFRMREIESDPPVQQRRINDKGGGGGAPKGETPLMR